MDDVDIKHRDALAREMCVWGNPHSDTPATVEAVSVAHSDGE